MATCTVACSAPSGIYLQDPAGLVPPITLKGPADLSQPLNLGLPAGAYATTPGVDTGAWARWSTLYANLVPAVCFLASTP